jgi:hypothetical protein
MLVDTTKETNELLRTIAHEKSFVKVNQDGGDDVTCNPRI